MIELGKIQNLKVVKKTGNGVYLSSKGKRDGEDVLLPKSQVPEGTLVGNELEVFVYRDSEDRIIATTKKPMLTMGELAILKVVEVGKFGAFMDWGLEKDLFLPFSEQIGKVSKGGKYLVVLYEDKTKRLCASMNIYNVLRTDSSYKEGDKVNGTVYSINKNLGALVAVDNRYHGLIPNNEMLGALFQGDQVKVRVKKVRQDGKLELTMKKEIKNDFKQSGKKDIKSESKGQFKNEKRSDPRSVRFDDAEKIFNRAKKNGGKLPLNDDSHPELIKAELNMSKAAFKRAAGKLLKDNRIKMTDNGIEILK